MKGAEHMVEFMTTRIEEAADVSIEKGIEKYKAYFIKPKKKIYERYREGVDTNLRVDGYEKCIVEG